MNDLRLAALRSAAEAGDRDAEDELVQGLAEVGDADGLRHWAQRGNTDAEDLLVFASVLSSGIVGATGHGWLWLWHGGEPDWLGDSG